MIKSKYIADILDLLLDGDTAGASARLQIPFLTDEDYEYTGSGLFVGFSHTDGIIKYKTSIRDEFINGVIITATEFPIEAEASLFFEEGLISYLEIWCYLGDYPHQELTKYTLTQAWNNSPGRQITTENPGVHSP
jgi:hypothetical protein